MASESNGTFMVERDGQMINVVVEGRAETPALVLLHSLGTSTEMWEPQMPSFRRRFRVVRIDARGHGKSSVPKEPANVEQLGFDVLAVLDKLAIKRARVCGLSMGGQVGIWLAQNHPHRVSHLIVANSAPQLGTAQIWNERIQQVKSGGMQGVIDATMARWLKQETRDANGEPLKKLRAMVLATNPNGYAACCAVVRDADLWAKIATISCPTLVISGTKDMAATAEAGQKTADAIPGARFLALDASHASNWEQPQAFTRAVIALLTRKTDDADRYALGLAIRRKVLGDARIDGIKLTPFNEDFQDFITRYVWGENWTRTGLLPQTRSCMILSIMIALGRWEEFRLHVRSAFNNGLDVDTIKEVILVCAIYCGVPAANAAMHHAEEELRAIGKLPPK